jgi:hypothetical protein
MAGERGLAVFHIGADRSLSWDVDASEGRRVHSSPHVADVDGDGHWDVVTHEFALLGTQPGEVVVRFGDGSGRFPARSLTPTGNDRYRWFESGDLDGDGRRDLAVLANGQLPYTGGRVVVLPGNGRRGFLGPDASMPEVYPENLLVGDMNGDGRDDLLMVNPPRVDYPFATSYTPGHIYHQGTDGLPAAPSERTVLRYLTDTIDLVDVDGDGAGDLVYLTALGDGQLQVNRQAGGRMLPPMRFGVPYTGRQDPMYDRDSTAFGDFNGDGVVDIVIAASYGSLVVLHGRLTPADASVDPPSPPRNPVATAGGAGTDMQLDFDPPADDGGSPILRYEVDADPHGGIQDVTGAVDPLALSRLLRGQENDTDYRYRVRAFNAGGAGEWSAWTAGQRVRQLPWLEVSAADVYETDGVARFVLRLADGPALSGGVSVDVATQDSGARAGEDYVAVVRTGVTIPEGQREAVVEVPLIADDVQESIEYFRLVLSNASGARLPGLPYGQVLIRRDPNTGTPLSLGITSAQRVEGNFGSQPLRFRVALSRPSEAPVSFDLATEPVSASEGWDYVARQAAGVTLAPGQTEYFFDVDVLGDLSPEPEETFRVTVRNVVGAYSANPYAVGTVVDDDSEIDGVPDLHDVAAEKGRLDLAFDYLPAGPLRFLGTALVQPDAREVLLGQDPTPGEAFDGLAAGTMALSTRVPANASETTAEVRLLVVAESDTARRLRLSVGRGATPGLGTTVCFSERNGAGQVCEVVLSRAPGAPAEDFWAVVQNLEPGGTGMDAVRLEAGAVTMVGADQAFFASGPGENLSALFLARLGWDSPGFEPGQRRLGYLLVESEPGRLLYHEPIRLLRTGDADAAHVLSLGEPRTVALEPGEAHERLVVDVPANAGSVVFSLEGEGEVSLHAAHDPAPAGPLIAPAPPRAAAQAQAQAPGASQRIVLEGEALRPGRWYLTPVNRGADPALVRVRADAVAAGPRPDFRPGHYYKPSRPGHGLFLDFAGDQWVMVWYTYLQDGTPTWYYTQGPAPAADQSQWSVDLLRVSRSRGGVTRAVDVGGASLTVLPGPAGASPKLAFGYNLDGDAGWEMLSRLGDDSCPLYDGVPLDASGHWYAPAQVGEGFSAQVLPNTEVHAVYTYDDSGYPRWLIGQKDYDPTMQPVTLQQLSGFCPTCPATPVSSQSVGVLTRRFAASSHIDGQPGIGSLLLDARFAPPLSGQPYLAAPIYLLSARKGCP